MKSIKITTVTHSLSEGGIDMEQIFISEGFERGRVIAEHKELFIVKTEIGGIEAEVTGSIVTGKQIGRAHV